MALSLQKGQKVDLTKGNPSLRRVVIGLGWNINKYATGSDFDLDAAAFMVGRDGKVTREDDFIFYNNLKSPCTSVTHMGDNLRGEDIGDAEQIMIDLSKVPSQYEKIAITVTIHEADLRRQNFGMVNNSYIRIFDEYTNSEILRFDLGEDFSVETAVVIAEIYRYNNEWKFAAIGSGFKGGLAALCLNYGIEV